MIAQFVAGQHVDQQIALLQAPQPVFQEARAHRRRFRAQPTVQSRVEQPLARFPARSNNRPDGPWYSSAKKSALVLADLDARLAAFELLLQLLQAQFHFG